MEIVFILSLLATFSVMVFLGINRVGVVIP